MDPHTRFTEEALKSQDGKVVPLTAFPGGPVIGKATLKYDPENKSLGAEISVADAELAKQLGANPSSVIFRQGE